MQTVVIVIHLMVIVAMIGVVLLQRSEGGGLGMGGGGGGFLTNRGTANVLTRTTATLAMIFFITSLALSLLAGLERKPRSIIQNTGAPASQQAPAGGSLLDQLRPGGGSGEGEAPAPPRPPQSQ